MNRWIRLSCVLFITATFMFVGLSGCKKDDAGKTITGATKTNGKKTDDKDKKKDDHEHPTAGPHGGVFAEWGEDEFHAELIVDAGKITVYVLGKDAKTAPKVDVAKITDVTVTVVKPEIKVVLKHDDKAKSDMGFPFVGTHEKFAKPDGLKVNISGKVDGKPYSGDVEYKAPKKSASLYLTPGGIYTVADIKANGNTVPDFRGIKAKHSKQLKPGDKICPVTEKKAQADFAWIVNGERYEFCCPPCLDNFIEWAHHEPGQIKKASEYVQKEM